VAELAVVVLPRDVVVADAAALAGAALPARVAGARRERLAVAAEEFALGLDELVLHVPEAPAPKVHVDGLVRDGDRRRDRPEHGRDERGRAEAEKRPPPKRRRRLERGSARGKGEEDGQHSSYFLVRALLQQGTKSRMSFSRKTLRTARVAKKALDALTTSDAI